MSDFTDELTRTLNSVIDKAKEYGGIAKIQALIKAEEAKKQEQYYRLGKKYYELYKDAPATDLSEIMDKLLLCDDKIEEYRKILKDAQDAKYTEVNEPETAAESEDVTSSESDAETCDAAESEATEETAEEAAEEAADDITEV